MEKPKVFAMIRHTNKNNISVTGDVALWGIKYPDQSADTRWESNGHASSSTHYDRYEDFQLLHIQLHPENKTEVLWYELTQIMPQAFFEDGDGI